jgi:receptor protein-tyrosine kinase
MSERSAHLVERAAVLLRSQAGLSSDRKAAPPPGTPSPVAPPEPAPAPRAPLPTQPDPPLPAPPPPTPAVTVRPLVDLETMVRAGLSVAGRERSRTAEEFRVVVDRVLRGLPGPDTVHGAGQLMLVTSAKPGEGKTFSTINIAGSIVRNGLRNVLLVDMDAKVESLSAQLGLSDSPGLLDLAADPSLRIEDLVARTALDGLSYLPIGRGAPSSKGGVTRSVAAAIERIAQRFSTHVILLDCPPCLSSSDPIALAPLVKTAVLVVEADTTQKNELESALRLLHACPNIMLMLNKMHIKADAVFGSYYYNYGGVKK